MPRCFLFPLFALAVLAAGASVACFRVARARRERTGLRLSWVGEVSSTTLNVGGAACALLAYHAVAHGFALGQFRAPLWAAPAAALVAVGLSLLVDRLENRRDDAASRDGEGPTPGGPDA